MTFRRLAKKAALQVTAASESFVLIAIYKKTLRLRAGVFSCILEGTDYYVTS